MDLLLFGLGLVILMVALVDALWTTLWVDGGAAPLARGVMRSIQVASERLFGTRHPALRSMRGTMMLVATFMVWVLLVWLGWILVFLADPASVVDTTTGEPQGLSGIVYFTGFTIFTLGVGDVTPNGGLWQLLTAVASWSGLFLITLTIAYLISVVDALVRQRGFADNVLVGECDPAGLVARLRGEGGWNGFEGFANGAITSLHTAAERHLAYPVLHFIVSSSPRKSLAIAVATIDEALNIMEHGIVDDRTPSGYPVTSLRAAISSYVDTLGRMSPGREDDTPPPPSLHDVGDVSTVEPMVFAHALHPLAPRRRRLLGLVETEGWSWDCVTQHATDVEVNLRWR